MFTIGEYEQFPMQMTHRHNKWLQILAEEDFPPKLLCNWNADLKFTVNNKGEDVNKKPRSRELEKTSLSTVKATMESLIVNTCHLFLKIRIQ